MINRGYTVYVEHGPRSSEMGSREELYTPITFLRCADDTVKIATTFEDLMELIIRLVTVGNGLLINVQKPTAEDAIIN